MPKAIHFYIDDSGTRQPDRQNTAASATRDWFALGGVLVSDADEGECRTRYERFCARWGINYPLHSTDIRHSAGRFSWLRTASKGDQDRFMRELSDFLIAKPVLGLACVIDRPGYNERYTKQYGRRKWLLCKTAFSIALERASKYALSVGNRKLKVYVERCNKSDDAKLHRYYEELKNGGAPFNEKNSGKYAPLEGEHYKRILYDIKFKQKTSPLIQIADLYLWPMCMGGYHLSNKPYEMLMKARKLVDAVCDKARVAEQGIKYSCFDLVKPQP